MTNEINFLLRMNFRVQYADVNCEQEQFGIVIINVTDERGRPNCKL